MISYVKKLQLYWKIQELINVSKVSRKKQNAWEKARWIELLLCNHKDLNSDHWHLCEHVVDMIDYV